MIASNLQRVGRWALLQKRLNTRSISQLTVLLLLSSICEQTTTTAFGPLSTAYRTDRTFSISRRYATFFSRSELERLTVPELKAQLRSSGLKVGGRKAELVDRLVLGSSNKTTSSSIQSSVNTEESDGSEDAVYDSVPSNAVVIFACKS